ncbi:hypothetical protein Tco_1229772 [Tanacetum coccineum]
MFSPIALPQDVPSTSDRHLIELENQVQRLMEAHLAPTQPTQVNKITTLCEICMEDPEHAFVEYASSYIDEAGGAFFPYFHHQGQDGVGLKRYHIVPYEELNGIPIALVARFGVVS